jgi:hypothetical protein
MKITIGASSIVSLMCFFLLCGCEEIHVPNFFGHDEVPDEIKAEPRVLDIAPPSTNDEDWPRLGDVPFKPKDFSPKVTSDHYMNELEFHRAEADVAKKEALKNDPEPATNAAPQKKQTSPSLEPPQFPDTQVPGELEPPHFSKE